MVKNYPTIIVIFSLLILVAYIYQLNKEENFTATTTTTPDSMFIHGTRRVLYVITRLRRVKTASYRFRF